MSHSKQEQVGDRPHEPPRHRRRRCGRRPGRGTRCVRAEEAADQKNGTATPAPSETITSGHSAARSVPSASSRLHARFGRFLVVGWWHRTKRSPWQHAEHIGGIEAHPCPVVVLPPAAQLQQLRQVTSRRADHEDPVTRSVGHVAAPDGGDGPRASDPTADAVHRGHHLVARDPGGDQCGEGQTLLGGVVACGPGEQRPARRRRSREQPAGEGAGAAPRWRAPFGRPGTRGARRPCRPAPRPWRPTC